MSKLYELTQQYSILNDFLDGIDNNEIDEQSIQTALANIEGKIQEKSANIAPIIKNAEHHINGLKDIENAIKNRIKIAEKNVDKLKQYLLTNLQNCGIKKVKSNFFDISIKNNPQKVEIYSQNLIPKEFFKETLTVSFSNCDNKIMQDFNQIIEKYSLSEFNLDSKLDKIRVKQAINNGTDIQGAAIVQTERLEIK